MVPFSRGRALARRGLNMTAPGLLFDQTPQPSQAPQPAPARKPSILDRILGRFFPQGASPYGGLLTEDQLSATRRGALSRMAASLLAESGPRPQGTTGPLEGLGHALQAADWPDALAQAGAQAGHINELKGQMDRRRAIEAVVQKYAPQPNETPQEAVQRINSIMGEVGQIGGPEAEQITQQLTAQVHGQQAAYEMNKPKEPPVSPTTIYSNAQSRLQPWEKVRAVVSQYELFRDAPLNAATSKALLDVANNIIGTQGGFPEESSVLSHAPGVVGELIKFLKGFAGQELLTADQREKLVAATDQVVSLLAEGYQRVRSDVERQMGNVFLPDNIPKYLPQPLTWPTFGRQRRTRRPGSIDPLKDALP